MRSIKTKSLFLLLSLLCWRAPNLLCQESKAKDVGVAITVEDYCCYLNAEQAVDCRLQATGSEKTTNSSDRFLGAITASSLNDPYDERMLGVLIMRTGLPGSYCYSLISKASADRFNPCIVGLSWNDAEHYCDWKNHSASTSTYNLNSCAIGAAHVDRSLTSNQLTFRLVNTKASSYQAGGAEVAGAAGAEEVGAEVTATLAWIVSMVEGGARRPERVRREGLSSRSRSSSPVVPSLMESPTSSRPGSPRQSPPVRRAGPETIGKDLDLSTSEQDTSIRVYQQDIKFLEADSNPSTQPLYRLQGTRGRPAIDWNSEEIQQREKDVERLKQERDQSAKGSPEREIKQKEFENAKQNLAYAKSMLQKKLEQETALQKPVASVSLERERQGFYRSDEIQQHIRELLRRATAREQEVEVLSTSKAESKSENVFIDRETKKAKALAQALKPPLDSIYLLNWQAWAEGLIRQANYFPVDFSLRELIAQHGMAHPEWVDDEFKAAWALRMKESAAVEKQAINEKDQVKLMKLRKVKILAEADYSEWVDDEFKEAWALRTKESAAVEKQAIKEKDQKLRKIKILAEVDQRAWEAVASGESFEFMGDDEMRKATLHAKAQFAIAKSAWNDFSKAKSLFEQDKNVENLKLGTSAAASAVDAAYSASSMFHDCRRASTDHYTVDSAYRASLSIETAAVAIQQAAYIITADADLNFAVDITAEAAEEAEASAKTATLEDFAETVTASVCAAVYSSFKVIRPILFTEEIRWAATAAQEAADFVKAAYDFYDAQKKTGEAKVGAVNISVNKPTSAEWDLSQKIKQQEQRIASYQQKMAQVDAAGNQEAKDRLQKALQFAKGSLQRLRELEQIANWRIKFVEATAGQPRHDPSRFWDDIVAQNNSLAEQYQKGAVAFEQGTPTEMKDWEAAFYHLEESAQWATQAAFHIIKTVEAENNSCPDLATCYQETAKHNLQTAQQWSHLALATVTQGGADLEKLWEDAVSHNRSFYKLKEKQDIERQKIAASLTQADIKTEKQKGVQESGKAFDLAHDQRAAFPDAIVLGEGEIDGPQSGQRTRVRILKTNFHYPLIRQEEIFDRATHEVIKQREMVADHCSIYLPAGETQESLRQKLEDPTIILEQKGRFHRIYFDLGHDPLHSLPEMIKKISTQFPQTCPEPDFLTFNIPWKSSIKEIELPPTLSSIKDKKTNSIIAEGDLNDFLPGQKIHVRILETDFHYPFIREEKIIDLATSRIIVKRKMVADHCSIYLPAGETQESLRQKLEDPTIILEQKGRFHRIYFDLGHDPLHSLPKIIKKISTQFPQACPEPDFIDKSSVKIKKAKWNLKNSLSDYFSSAVSQSNVAASRNSSSILLAVVDSGIRHDHEALRLAMWRGANEIHGYNGISYRERGNDDHDIIDGDGHGTHCAGIIEAISRDMIDVAPNVQLMSCKFMRPVKYKKPLVPRSKTLCEGSPEDAAYCIEKALDERAHILNYSAGGNSFNAKLYDVLKQAEQQGAIFVTAAGNEYSDNNLTPYYPSNYAVDHDAVCGYYRTPIKVQGLNNILSVASINRFNKISASSNFGKGNVHLAAPGYEIYSTLHYADNAYGWMSGTSMAAPHVAGALALIKAKFPYLPYQSLIHFLKESVDKTQELEAKTIFGGRLNLGKALINIQHYLNQSVGDVPHSQLEKWAGVLGGEAMFAAKVAREARENAYSEKQWEEAIKQAQDAKEAWTKRKEACEKGMSLCNLETAFMEEIEQWPKALEEAKQEEAFWCAEVLMLLKHAAQKAEAIAETERASKVLPLADRLEKFHVAENAWNKVVETCLKNHKNDPNDSWMKDAARAQAARIKWSQEKQAARQKLQVKK